MAELDDFFAKKDKKKKGKKAKKFVGTTPTTIAKALEVSEAFLGEMSGLLKIPKVFTTRAFSACTGKENT